MSREDSVSLWLGVVESEQFLGDFKRVSYSEDGDFLGSPFTHVFKIECYDEDFCEIAHVPVSKEFSGLLMGCSYDEVVIPRFTEAFGESGIPAGANALILLYNFDYDGSVRDVRAKGAEFKYIGSVGYR